MDYATSAYNKVVEAYNNLRQFVHDSMIFPRGLEAIAGMPNGFARDEGVSNALDSYIFQTNIDRWYTDNKGRVIVIGNNGKKTVPLNPKSVQHDSHGYVKKSLIDGGLRATSAIIKKIAKDVEKLRQTSGN